MTRRIIHAITPGDHFSPRTGSAIPTVVHGLARAALASEGDDARHAVLVDSTTFRPRYESAEVLEYTGAMPTRRAERIADAALARLGVARRSAVRAWQPVSDALRDQSPSIVIAHNAPALPRLLGDQPHTTVLYAHNDLFRTVGRREAERTLDGVAAIVCVSEDLARHTASRLPRSLARRVHIVDNGIDTEAFAPRDEPRSDAHPLRLMYVGRVIADKGPDVLLRAAALLPHDDIEVVIVGSTGFDAAAPLTPYERSLRDLAGKVSGRVAFEPFVDRGRLPDLLRTADIFVVPSRWREPSGLTIGEAMATGLPVIASAVGGIPEVVGDAGVLIDADDAERLATEITTLRDDPLARAALGQSALRRARARSWRRSWNQLRAILESI
ncbi:glycosyltransferase family 4 protein [Microbacterium sp. NPDC055357]